MAGLLNQIGKSGGGRVNQAKGIELGDPFVYKHMGSMASVGSYKALVDLRQSKVTQEFNFKTFTLFVEDCC